MNNYDFLLQFQELSKGQDFTTNIPELTRDNIATVGNAIMDYQPAKDFFYNAFMQKIALQLFNHLIADNKFKFLKGQNVTGDIEESYVDYIKGKQYDPESEDLLKNVKATIKTLYHKMDRQLLYETSLSDVQLRNAFLSPNGLTTLMGQVVDTLYQSAEWDEFTMIKELIAKNIKHATKEAQKVYIGDASVDIKQRAFNLLEGVKRVSNKLTYVSRNYNKLGLAQATPKGQQLLVLHDDYEVNIDMGVLAGVFNIDKVDLKSRIIGVDNFNNDTNKIVAVLVDERAFRYHDVLRAMETFRNGQTLTTKYFLHVWLLISMSYLYNSVYFIEDKAPTNE